MCVSTMTLSEAYQDCQNRLTQAGILISSGVAGLYGFSGTFEDVVDSFERLVTSRGRHLGAEVMRFPPIMSRANYLKTTHLSNFPDLLGSVHSFTGNEKDHFRLLEERERGDDWTKRLTPTEVMMTPAACYPL
ncbi:MAG: hypothetical protein FJ267_10795, partial [Planctomycetes bacterium]|nr:hypothetical protein [Planctomycetota bacterium]